MREKNYLFGVELLTLVQCLTFVMIEFRLLQNDNTGCQQTANKLIMADIKLRLRLEVDRTNVIKLSDMLSDETKRYSKC